MLLRIARDCSGMEAAALASGRYGSRLARNLTKVGGEGGIRTHVPVTRQDAFEAPPLRPLRYLSGLVGSCRWKLQL